MSTWGRRGVPRSKRNRILNRDNHQSQIRGIGCTITATEVDDIIPVAVSGITPEPTPTTIYCNARRAARPRRPQRHPGD